MNATRHSRFSGLGLRLFIVIEGSIFMSGESQAENDADMKWEQIEGVVCQEMRLAI